jgi:EAL domain-containing protein (putative c-di-GMP-specific phosphodiesterase class I)/CHASE2 domain-containing sensor protein
MKEVCSVRLRKAQKGEGPRWKLLLWTAVASLIFGLIGAGELPEDMLRASRNQLHAHKASGDIVLVAIDDRSLREIGRWPWPRREYANMINNIDAAGAKRTFVDIIINGRSEAADDAAVANAIEKAGNVTLAVSTRAVITGQADQPDLLPPAVFSKNAELGLISVNYNYQNAVWKLDYNRRVGDQIIPSFAAKLANADPKKTGRFLPDYSTDPRTVPVIAASDIINGKFDPRALKGKDVVIGAASEGIGDQYFVPGWGKMPGAYVHIIGGETLKAGTPQSAGWLPALLLALAACALAVRTQSAKVSNVALIGTAAILLLAPIGLEAVRISVDVLPALFAIIVIGVNLTWRRWKQRGLVNSVSGLPNLSALRANKTGKDRALIAARILNYSEIASALPAEQERQLVEQIVSRLRVGAPDRTLYEGDAGIFAWFEDPDLPFGNHVEALYSLFRNPARVGSQTIDLSISFGVELGSGRSLGNRFASALVAAEEAAHDGLKWKYHDPEELEDVTWKLSILSQLDDAVDKGEVWVAYQPKFDLKRRRIVGAEALARWTHPEKGPIAASEFVAAAEQHDRIGKLTDFVLDKAIGGAVAINRKQPGFSMAVNLSARLLSDKGLILRLRAMLARHGLAPEQLTLELTETAELANSGAALDMLAALRGLGITIAIDDYGTGLSTLDYLKKIPASEIKIDQSFVKTMLDNRSDLVMVQSTIALAHSLGRKVVAEGVENQNVLDALIDMGCDVAQGYVIGRPMSLDSLMKRISAERRSSVA